jgi:hypothetical protein
MGKRFKEQDDGRTGNYSWTSESLSVHSADISRSVLGRGNSRKSRRAPKELCSFWPQNVWFQDASQNSRLTKVVAQLGRQACLRHAAKLGVSTLQEREDLALVFMIFPQISQVPLTLSPTHDGRLINIP